MHYDCRYEGHVKRVCFKHYSKNKILKVQISLFPPPYLALFLFFSLKQSLFTCPATPQKLHLPENLLEVCGACLAALWWGIIPVGCADLFSSSNVDGNPEVLSIPVRSFDMFFMAATSLWSKHDPALAMRNWRLSPKNNTYSRNCIVKYQFRSYNLTTILLYLYNTHTCMFFEVFIFSGSGQKSPPPL